eukprot:CAMPEP_0119310420 /NCGR_PEP_ID=MMETSP1333-20130426/19394_1 /TAXON_ID=418940 /ORGANISM="Scyphosphaera apsteinii, Strain RCC1455" /LENGTH=153 /DNA_ID=CAMNT_0007314603 /DNA_START=214 /DNA_END=675 /DNA_ORIENTATION=+
MKHDWDRLATAFEGDPKLLIADIDCTAAGKPLCGRFNVNGFPTIKTFTAGDAMSETYNGGRDFLSLKRHAESLGPKAEARSQELANYAAMSPERRQGLINKLESALKKEFKRHFELEKMWQKKSAEEIKPLEALKKKLKHQIKVLQMATPKAS